ncbi:hydroxyethylthiazole kinase-like sugar kinase family protein [Planomicrobium koreense]|uniref:Hydroxyethylthiazole kinase-like sugar kinase family protein n=1 Tax=Planococcus koreensis TaxID=112331 RepID=A0A7W8FT79_9BACL|nr:hypothetical protein [Planococcus koreensis]MBB5179771.1 hydroxyethylthiazole kinase-like sugar kinase family protein [Planococcus koreensis]
MKMGKKIAAAAVIAAVLVGAIGQLEETEVKAATASQAEAKPMAVPVILPPL